MPQFAPSEAKTALAPITVKPAGLPCQVELFLGPDEGTKVATSGMIAFTSTGSEQSVSLPVTMPSEEGPYHVYLDVYAGDYLIVSYIATEDVVIAPAVPAVGDFVYSDEFFELRPLSEIISTAGYASCYVVFHCTITNRGAARGTRTIGIYHQCYSTYYKKYYDPRLKRAFELTLEPGQSYRLIFDPRINATRHVEDGFEYWVNDDDFIVLAHGAFVWYVFLLDSAGGESAHPSAT